MKWCTVIVLAVASIAVACGGGSGGSQEEADITNSVVGLFDAVNDGDAVAVHGHLSQDCQKKVPLEEVEDSVTEAKNFLGATRLEVKDVQVETLAQDEAVVARQ